MGEGKSTATAHARRAALAGLTLTNHARTELFTVEKSQPGVRLDKFLCTRFPAVSRGAIQRLIERQGLPASLAVAVLDRNYRFVARVPAPEWAQVADAHEEVHGALVASSGSVRLLSAHRALAGELRLFMVALRGEWSAERTAAHHEALVEELEAEGIAALRRHLRDGEEAVRSGLHR